MSTHNHFDSSDTPERILRENIESPSDLLNPHPRRDAHKRRSKIHKRMRGRRSTSFTDSVLVAIRAREMDLDGPSPASTDPERPCAATQPPYEPLARLPSLTIGNGSLSIPDQREEWRAIAKDSLPLLGGEDILIRAVDVLLLNKTNSTWPRSRGTLWGTNYRLLFQREHDQLVDSFPLKGIHVVKKKSKAHGQEQIKLYTHDMRALKLTFDNKHRACVTDLKISSSRSIGTNKPSRKGKLRKRRFHRKDKALVHRIKRDGVESYQSSISIASEHSEDDPSNDDAGEMGGGASPSSSPSLHQHTPSIKPIINGDDQDDELEEGSSSTSEEIELPPRDEEPYPLESIVVKRRVGMGDEAKVVADVESIPAHTSLDATTGATRQKQVKQSELVYQLLMGYVHLRNARYVFAFRYSPTITSTYHEDGEEPEGDTNGHHLYDLHRDLGRLGIPDRHWQITTINCNYALSATYPSILCVPRSIGDREIQAVAKYRSKGRIPALCWRHPNTKAPLLRASQPLVGIQGRRCVEDEALLSAVLRTTTSTNPSAMLHVIDARPKANAVANKTIGGGYEQTQAYSRCKLQFMGIDNIHKMRESLWEVFKLIKAGQGDVDERWPLLIEGTGWLKHIRHIFQAVDRIVYLLKHGHPVLAHCSDGWDRTAQLNSLAQLLLDPYYRTLEGFAVLIEKEWLSFGHKFAERCGHGEEGTTSGREKEKSPVFLQFLDCVHQICWQYPCSMEFSPELLVFLADECHNCRFGTFLYNNEASRQRHGIRKHTISIWTHVLYTSAREGYSNPFYRPNDRTLKPSCSLKTLRFWDEFFLRWDTPSGVKESVARRLAVIMKQHNAMHGASTHGALATDAMLDGGDCGDNDGGVDEAMVQDLTEEGIMRRGEEVAGGAKDDGDGDGIAGDGDEHEATPLPHAPSMDRLPRRDQAGCWPPRVPPRSDVPHVDRLETRRTHRGMTATMGSYKYTSTATSGSSEARARRLEDSVPPPWIPDSWVSHCTQCAKAFSRLNRKHHCRACGRIFCRKCSSKRARIPQLYNFKYVRVCSRCHAMLMDRHREDDDSCVDGGSATLRKRSQSYS